MDFDAFGSQCGDDLEARLGARLAEHALGNKPHGRRKSGCISLVIATCYGI